MYNLYSWMSQPQVTSQTPINQSLLMHSGLLDSTESFTWREALPQPRLPFLAYVAKQSLTCSTSRSSCLYISFVSIPCCQLFWQWQMTGIGTLPMTPSILLVWQSSGRDMKPLKQTRLSRSQVRGRESHTCNNPSLSHQLKTSSHTCSR